MAALTVTEIKNTSGSVTLTGGGWADAAGGFATNAFPSSTTLKVTSTSGNTCTVSWTGRALYLNFQAYISYGAFTNVTDGVTIAGDFSCANGPVNTDGTAALSGIEPRTLIAICRGLTDTTHTTVLTCQKNVFRTVSSGSLGLSIDSFIAISGNQLSPTAGSYVSLGDSWGGGQGAFQSLDNGYPYIVTRNLQQSLKRTIALNNGALSGSCWFAGDNSSKLGVLWRLFGADPTFGTLGGNGLSGMLSYAPEFVSLLLGANDLRSMSSGGQYLGYGSSALDFARHVNTALAFIEDTLDVYGAFGTPVKVAMCSPGYLTPNIMWSTTTTFQSSTSPFDSGGLSTFEQATFLTEKVVARYPWARYAGVFESMAYDDDFLLPNNQTGQSVQGFNYVTYTTDTGLHPNDSGHAIIAEEISQALLSGTTNLPLNNPPTNTNGVGGSRGGF